MSGHFVVDVPARYRRRLASRDLLRVLDEAEWVIGQLRRHGPGLLERAKHEVRDGYPTSTARQPTGKGGVSDPVGELVVDETWSDPIRDLAEEMCEAVVVALDVLRRAAGARERSVPPPAKAELNEKGVPCCINHARFELYAAQFRAGRCRFCYDWRRDHEFADAPETAIRALEDKRIERELRRSA